MKRIRLISIVVAVIVLGGLAFAILRAREPRYQGRTLSEWIGDGDKASRKFSRMVNPDRDKFEADPDWQRASHAVKQIGYEAVPFLVRWFQADDSPAKKKTPHPPYAPAESNFLSAKQADLAVIKIANASAEQKQFALAANNATWPSG